MSYYCPANAVVGDVIPYFTGGEFKVFYLQLGRGANAHRSPEWFLLGTCDAVHYDEYGSCGIFGGTGAVLQAGDGYHMFYCEFPDGRQIVSHAISPDLIHWEPIPADSFGPDPAWYAASDWRDPFVFWNEEAGQYWLLVSARTRSPYARGGCVGLCVSDDLHSWQARPPLFAPDLHVSALECPDVFRMGDWWYLVYSTYTDRFATHYRMSRSASGPWLAPAEDTLDGRAFYAAKTASDGQHRYLFGWNPTRTENLFDWNPPGYAGRDFNTWDWGGNLVVHDLHQAADGTLQVRLPDGVAAQFQRSHAVTLTPAIGQWHLDGTRHTARSPVGFAGATAGALPTHCLITGQIRFRPGTRRLGLLLRASAALDQGYAIQFEPDRQRVVLKSFVFPNEHGGKILPFEVELERSVPLRPDQDCALTLVLADSVCEVYVDDQVALSTRMYDRPNGSLVFFVADGEATFSDFAIRTP